MDTRCSDVEDATAALYTSAAGDGEHILIVDLPNELISQLPTFPNNHKTRKRRGASFVAMAHIFTGLSSAPGLSCSWLGD
ncbi:putative lipoprotein [Anopheles sinensis]|uniref:Putative lipoprotein n=1 Tax=Anopheles sinensis TaxID=74873 RepID=A0A084VKP4_ANOSI|nr:putative lipoprotein [Anopheles sinensis]